MTIFVMPSIHTGKGCIQFWCLSFYLLSQKSGQCPSPPLSSRLSELVVCLGQACHAVKKDHGHPAPRHRTLQACHIPENQTPPKTTVFHDWFHPHLIFPLFDLFWVADDGWREEEMQV